MPTSSTRSHMLSSPMMRLPFSSSPAGESTFYPSFVDSTSATTLLGEGPMSLLSGSDSHHDHQLSLSPGVFMRMHQEVEDEEREELDDSSFVVEKNPPTPNTSVHEKTSTMSDTVLLNAVTPSSRARSSVMVSSSKSASQVLSVSPETPALAQKSSKHLLHPSTPSASSISATTTTHVADQPRRASMGNWTYEEDEILRMAVEANDAKSWKTIALSLPGRTDVQCLHRWQKVLKPGLIKGPWTEEEDQKVLMLVERYGQKKWSTIAKELGGRLGKQCRERWYNHLNPDIKKGNWTKEEDQIIMDYHMKMGNKWAKMAAILPGRTDNAIKNRWNSTLKKVVNEGGYKVSSGTTDMVVSSTEDYVSDSSKPTAIIKKRKAKHATLSPPPKINKMQDEETVTKVLVAASARMYSETPRESFLSPTRQITREDDLIAAEALSVLSSPKLHSPVPHATAAFEGFTPNSCKITYSESNTIFSPVKTDGKNSSCTVSNSSGSHPNSPKYPLYRHKAMPTTPIRSDGYPPRAPLLDDLNSIERTDSIMDDADSLLFLSKKSVKS